MTDNLLVIDTMQKDVRSAKSCHWDETALMNFNISVKKRLNTDKSLEAIIYLTFVKMIQMLGRKSSEYIHAKWVFEAVSNGTYTNTASKPTFWLCNNIAKHLQDECI